MILSIIIPCYNEGRTIVEIVNRILDVKGIEKQIIIIDDNSLDNSKKAVKRSDLKKGR